MIEDETFATILDISKVSQYYPYREKLIGISALVGRVGKPSTLDNRLCENEYIVHFYANEKLRKALGNTMYSISATTKYFTIYGAVLTPTTEGEPDWEV